MKHRKIVRVIVDVVATSEEDDVELDEVMEDIECVLNMNNTTDASGLSAAIYQYAVINVKAEEQFLTSATDF